MPGGRLGSASSDSTVKVHIFHFPFLRCASSWSHHGTPHHHHHNQIWDVTTGSLLVVLKHSGACYALRLLPNTLLATACLKKDIHLWDWESPPSGLVSPLSPIHLFIYLITFFLSFFLFPSHTHTYRGVCEETERPQEFGALFGVL